jgi:uncharacterized membrane protein
MVDAGVLTILFFGHILSAMGWLGGGILTASVLGPGVRSLSPGANLEFTAKVMPKIIRFVEIMVGSTLLFGVLLYLYLGISPSTGDSGTLYTGIGFTIVVAALAFSVTIPSFNKLVKMARERLASGSQGPPSPEMMKYGKRAAMGSMIGVGLLLVVLATMIGTVVGI